MPAGSLAFLLALAVPAKSAGRRIPRKSFGFVFDVEFELHFAICHF
jgi:hypothetical protein